jgi:hypothetical protein
LRYVQISLQLRTDPQRQATLLDLAEGDVKHFKYRQRSLREATPANQAAMPLFASKPGLGAMP